MRHKNQSKGVAGFVPHPRTIGLPQHTPGARVAGYTDESTVKRDAEALDAMKAKLPKKPSVVRR